MQQTKLIRRISTELGFFYLDIRDATGVVQYQDGDNDNAEVKVLGNDFLSTAHKLFDVAEEFYSLPVEEKVKYDFKDQGSYFGYKGYGAGVIDKEGTKDRNEFYNVRRPCPDYTHNKRGRGHANGHNIQTSKDDILRLGPSLPCPPVMESHKPLMRTYITTSHAIVTALLSSLATLLHLPSKPAGSALTALHKLTVPSGDQVRFVRSPPQPAQDRRTALGAHTDFGSVTLLFNRLGGLQILPPGQDINGGDDAWLYVRPLPGHCIVNLGDALVKFTRGVLRSNTHRVVNPPGEEQGSLTRMSLVYFARPNDEVLLRALQGSDIIDARKVSGEDEGKEEVITAKEWVLRRALGRRGVGKYEDSEGTEGMRGNARSGGMRDVHANGVNGHEKRNGAKEEDGAANGRDDGVKLEHSMVAAPKPNWTY